MGWLAEESEIVASSEKMILKYNPHWSAHGMKRFTYPFPDEAKCLFEVEASFIYDVPVTFTSDSWHGRMKACRGIGASLLTEREIAEFEKEHLEYLKSVPAVFDILHFVNVLNLRKI